MPKRDMRLLRPHRLPLALCAVLATTALHAASATILGYWVEPSGSLIRIATCGHKLCIYIASLPPGRPATDVHNPDRALRDRPLCGLRIGEDFSERDPLQADGGHLYDPKSGRTYRGSMTADGDLLHLRGYVGLKLFGRTETWKRASGPPPRPCGAK